MWYGSKYSMAVQAEMLCLFSRSLPPVLSCDWFSPDFQQWETSVEQLMLNALLTAWLSPKVKRGSPYHPTVMTELLVCFSLPGFFFFCFKDAELTRCQRHDAIRTCFHSIQQRKRRLQCTAWLCALMRDGGTDVLAFITGWPTYVAHWGRINNSIISTV